MDSPVARSQIVVVSICLSALRDFHSGDLLLRHSHLRTPFPSLVTPDYRKRAPTASEDDSDRV
jgi:hypothetical protein